MTENKEVFQGRKNDKRFWVAISDTESETHAVMKIRSDRSFIRSNGTA